MDEKQEKQATVPYFIHEGDMARMETAMEKLKKALIAVCVTLAFVVTVFAVTFTVNNSNWIKYAETLKQMETDNGIHEQPDQGAYP